MNIERLQSVDEKDLMQINVLLNQLRTDKTVAEKAIVEKMLADADTEIWVAREGGTVVGMATLLLVQKLPALVAYVDDVVVDESARGRGLGKTIMEKIIERARERGVNMMALTSKPSREAANSMYLKLGFEKKDTNVYRLTL